MSSTLKQESRKKGDARLPPHSICLFLTTLTVEAWDSDKGEKTCQPIAALRRLYEVAIYLSPISGSELRIFSQSNRCGFWTDGRKRPKYGLVRVRDFPDFAPQRLVPKTEKTHHPIGTIRQFFAVFIFRSPKGGFELPK